MWKLSFLSNIDNFWLKKNIFLTRFGISVFESSWCVPGVAFPQDLSIYPDITGVRPGMTRGHRSKSTWQQIFMWVSLHQDPEDEWIRTDSKHVKRAWHCSFHVQSPLSIGPSWLPLLALMFALCRLLWSARWFAFVHHWTNLWCGSIKDSGCWAKHKSSGICGPVFNCCKRTVLRSALPQNSFKTFTS